MPPHFFVASDGDCSFCGATSGETRTLVRASESSTRICDECLAVCCDLVEGQRGYASSPCALNLDDEAATTSALELRCAFCGAARSEVERLVCGPRMSICDRCVVAVSATRRA